jgi:hypothetical protein
LTLPTCKPGHPPLKWTIQSCPVHVFSQRKMKTQQPTDTSGMQLDAKAQQFAIFALWQVLKETQCNETRNELQNIGRLLVICSPARLFREFNDDDCQVTLASRPFLECLPETPRLKMVHQRACALIVGAASLVYKRTEVQNMVTDEEKSQFLLWLNAGGDN